MPSAINGTAPNPIIKRVIKAVRGDQFIYAPFGGKRPWGLIARIMAIKT